MTILDDLIAEIQRLDITTKQLREAGVPKGARQRLCAGLYRGKGVIDTIVAAGKAVGWDLAWEKGPNKPAIASAAEGAKETPQEVNKMPQGFLLRQIEMHKAETLRAEARYQELAKACESALDAFGELEGAPELERIANLIGYQTPEEREEAEAAREAAMPKNRVAALVEERDNEVPTETRGGKEIVKIGGPPVREAPPDPEPEPKKEPQPTEGMIQP